MPNSIVPSGSASLDAVENRPLLPIILRSYSAAKDLLRKLDSKKVDPPAVMEAVLFGGAVPAPATAPRRMAPGKPAVAAPPPLYVIEVISGGKRENKTFATP